MSEKIIYPDMEEFKELIKTENVVLVDFWATWCGPCKMVAPVIEELAEDFYGKATVAKVDVDEHGSLAAEYDIHSIPTVVVFHKGEKVAKEVGVKPKSAYADILNKLVSE